MLGRRYVQGLIERHFSSFRKSQRTTISDLAVGLLKAGKVGLAAIARGMVDDTTVRHRIKRIWRFETNDRVSTSRAMQCLTKWVLSGAKEVVIALDWTYLGDRVLLAAKVAVRRRAVPIAWLVMEKAQFDKDRKSRNDAEEQLIQRLREMLGAHPWILLADRGFARADLVAKLTSWDVRFVIRACGSTWVQWAGFAGALDNVPRKPGRAKRYDGVLYQKRRRVPVGLVVTHREPAAEAWYLVTNVEGTKEVVRFYRQRMWIEESFRDAKSNLGLHKLWLATAERIERMLIIVAVVMWLAVLVALDYVARHGEVDPQLSTKKRGGTLSVFRTGLELIRALGMPPNLRRVRLPLATEAL